MHKNREKLAEQTFFKKKRQVSTTRIYHYFLSSTFLFDDFIKKKVLKAIQIKNKTDKLYNVHLFKILIKRNRP